MIRALIFDCFGVLAQGTWKRFTDSLPDTTDWQSLHDLNHAHDAGFIDDESFTSEVQRITGTTPPFLEDMRVNEYHVNASILDFMQAHRGAYKYAIMSNISSNWITSHLLSTDQQALFDDIIVSSEVGVAKPHQGIYDIAIQRLGVPAEEIIFIDDAQENITAAEYVGMNAILYTDYAALKKQLKLFGVG